MTIIIDVAIQSSKVDLQNLKIFNLEASLTSSILQFEEFCQGVLLFAEDALFLINKGEIADIFGFGFDKSDNYLIFTENEMKRVVFP